MIVNISKLTYMHVCVRDIEARTMITIINKKTKQNLIFNHVSSVDVEQGRLDMA